MKFDDLLNYLGEFGPYQRRLYVLMNITSICIAFQTLVPVFLFYVPDHRCSLPGYPNDTFAIQNNDHAQLINRTIPGYRGHGEGVYSECNVYNAGVHKVEVPCHKWVYEQTTMTSSAASYLNLICSNADYRAHANMALMAGKLVAGLLQGLSSDYFGRKKTFVVCMLALVAASFGNVFINSIPSLIILRFLAGLTTTSTFMSAFVLGMELVGPSKRVLAGIGIQFFWQLGIYILLLLAYLIRDWRHLMLALALPTIFYIPLCCLVRESPRWLLSKGRKQEAEVIIQEAARYNKVNLPEGVIGEMEGLIEEKGGNQSIKNLFKSRVLAVRSAVIFFNWAVASGMYYGLTLNISNMSGDIYNNFFWSATLEGVGHFLCFLLLDRVGRKWFYFTSMLFAGLACGCSIIPLWLHTSHAVETLMVLSWIGRMCVTAAYSTLYIYTAELFPTPLRNSIMGAGSLSARIGGIIAPYIANMGIYIGGIFKDGLPMLAFSLFAIIAAILSLSFPETLNRKLPDTLEEAEQFSRIPQKKKSAVI